MDPELCFNFDIHICGACRTQLPTIELFIQHKQLCNFFRSKAGLLTQGENEINAEKSPNSNDNDEKSQEGASKSSSSCSGSPKKARLQPDSPQLPMNLADDNQNNQEDDEEDTEPSSPLLEPQVDMFVPQVIADDNEPNNMATTSSSTTQANTNRTKQANTSLRKTPVKNRNSTKDISMGGSSPTTAALSSNTPVTTNEDGLANSTMQPNIPLKKTPVKYIVLETGGPKRYKCEYGSCSYTTLYMKDLERHFRTHTGEKPYFCWQCGKRFTRSDKLKNHERIHTGERPHKCTICSYATIDRSTLLKHMRIHSDEKPFKCQICPHACRNSSQLIVHLRTHTGDTPFHCQICSVKFKVNCDLKRHMLLHTGEKPYACVKCDYKCSVKGNLKTHMKLKHSEGSDLSCEHCPFVSCSRSDLREHVRLHADKPLHCSQCSYSATNASTLKIHQRVHSTEKPFQCEFCPYTSRQVYSIRTHLRNKHPEMFLRMATRKTQKKSTGEDVDSDYPKSVLQVKSSPCLQSFKCPICTAGFARKDSLQSHLRQHQLIQGETQPAVALAMLQLQTVARDIIVTSRSQLEESQQPDRPISPLPQIDVKPASGFEPSISPDLTTDSDLLDTTQDLEDQSGIQFLMPDAHNGIPENSAQFVFQVPNSLGLLSLPLVSQDDDNTATLNSEGDEKAILQMPSVQYILQS